jgi:hypothetical protein
MACCGFVVAAILKYADALLKAYSTCGAMLMTSLFSAATLHAAVPKQLICGMLLACASVIMFYGNVEWADFVKRLKGIHLSAPVSKLVEECSSVNTV